MIFCSVFFWSLSSLSASMPLAVLTLSPLQQSDLERACCQMKQNAQASEKHVISLCTIVNQLDPK